MIERIDMFSANFTVRYDGEALRDGRMDVRRLAPALLAIGDLCEEANRALNGDRARASVQVKAFKQGSFGVELILDVNLLEKAKALVLGHGIKDAKDILETLGFYKSEIAAGVGGLIAFVKWVRGRRIEEATSLQNGLTRVTLPHGEQSDVRDEVLDLYQRKAIQHDLREIAAPVATPGIDRWDVLQNHRIVQSIEEEDVDAFQALEDGPLQDDPVLSDSTIERAYEVVSLSKKPRVKWRLWDGENEISVRVDDETLYDRMNEGTLGIEPGFFIWAKIHTRAYQDGDTLKVENTLLEIKDRKPPRLANDPKLFD